MFKTVEARDELAKRLNVLVLHMMDACSQGGHMTIVPTDQMICDVMAAAHIVSLAPLKEESR